MLTGVDLLNTEFHTQRIVREGVKRAQDFDGNTPPKPNYEPPREFAPFKHLREIGLDIETLDPSINDGKGPGCYTDDGKIVGVGIAYDAEHAVYYPVAHDTSLSRNVRRPEAFFDWLRGQAADYRGTIIGANVQYDLDWLRARHGVVFPHARVEDVQWAECLLDENRMRYALDILANEYLGEGKHTEGLSRYGRDYIKNMNRVDPGWAAEYCEQDCIVAVQIMHKQRPLLEANGLNEVWDIECRGAHILLEMRARGVRVDTVAAQSANDRLLADAKAEREHLRSLVDFSVDPWSGESLAQAFNKLDIAFPRTEKGAPSFRKAWLTSHGSELARTVVGIREKEKTAGTFIQSYIIDGNINGRLHTIFHPLKGDTNGTVSGRYSSSNPNLQNIPARHPEYGPLMRSMFLPEEDHDWGSADWSQIEYRLLAHFCSLVPAVESETLIARYRSDATTDFHAIAAEIAGTDRKTAKNINFGVVYGMGVAAMAINLGVTVAEAETILNEFHGRAPYLRQIYGVAERRAQRQGYIRTIAGRRRRFTDWSVGRGASSKYFRSEASAHEYASKNGMAVSRAHTHKALNALLQGSAADLMKKAMVDMWEAGLFNDGCLIPHLTVHDEMNVSVPRTAAGREAFDEMRNIMTNAWALEVPVLVDAALGATWQEAK